MRRTGRGRCARRSCTMRGSKGGRRCSEVTVVVTHGEALRSVRVCGQAATRCLLCGGTAQLHLDTCACWHAAACACGGRERDGPGWRIRHGGRQPTACRVRAIGHRVLCDHRRPSRADASTWREAEPPCIARRAASSGAAQGSRLEGMRAEAASVASGVARVRLVSEEATLLEAQARRRGCRGARRDCWGQVRR